MQEDGQIEMAPADPEINLLYTPRGNVCMHEKLSARSRSVTTAG